MALPPAEGPPPKKILVCDDDETLVDILAKLLTDNGFDVNTAHDGFQCLEKLIEERPQALLLDLDMPNKDGFQIMEALNRDKRLPHPEIVVLSGHEKAGDKERALQLGAKRFFVKPFVCKEVLEAVKLLLEPETKSDAPA